MCLPLVGRQEGHPACKKWGHGGGGHWLVRMEWHPAGCSVCLPLLIFPCTTKSRSSLLAPADLDGPGKRAVNQFWWWLACRSECAVTAADGRRQSTPAGAATMQRGRIQGRDVAARSSADVQWRRSRTNDANGRRSGCTFLSLLWSG